MTKYDGLNLVSSEVTENKTVNRRKKSLPSFLVRTVAAALVGVAAFAAGKWIDWPFKDKVAEVLRSAVCYEMIPSSGEAGEIPAAKKLTDREAAGEDEGGKGTFV